MSFITKQTLNISISQSFLSLSLLLRVSGPTGVEESTLPLTSRMLHLLFLLLQSIQLRPCTHHLHSPTPLRTPLAPDSSLLLSVISPSRSTPLDHRDSTLPGLPLVHNPLLSHFHPPSLSPPSQKKISTGSGTTVRTSKSFLFLFGSSKSY